MSMRTGLNELMNEMKAGINKLVDTIDENLDDFVAFCEMDEQAISETDIGEKVSIFKTNDLTVRSLGDALEQLSVRVLSLQAPVSRDLRRVISSFRMIYDLERISRDAYNAYKRLSMIDTENIKVLMNQIKSVNEVLHSSKKLLAQFKEIYNISLKDSKIDYDPIVKQSIELDSKIDGIFENNSSDIVKLANDGKLQPENAFHFLSAFRSLERMGDHACNLIERSIYIQTGDKIEVK